MAATKTSRNDTPNTPSVSESKIAGMKVGELRRRLKDRGVKGTEDLRKPDLVKKLIKAEVKGASAKKSTAKTSTAKASTGKTSTGKTSTAKASTAKKSTAKTSAATKSSAKKSSAKKSTSTTSGGKNPTSRNDTPNTPGVGESRIAAMKVDELRRELKSRGVKGTADLKKADLVKKLIKADTAKSGSAASKSASGASKSGSVTSTKSSGGGGKRTGKATSDSLKYSQEIRSTSDKPERPGRSLVTTDHDVIRQWAEARKAVPATVAGTEHSGHLGVLRFDFPGYSGDRLQEVSWDDWFDAFDKRRLNFIYQQKQTSGKQSNFFQLENPDE